MRLDTGDRQPEAEALYRSAGYAAIPDYNGNFAASIDPTHPEKRLVG